MTDFFSKRKAAMALDIFIYHFKSIPDKKSRGKNTHARASSERGGRMSIRLMQDEYTTDVGSVYD